MSSSDQASSAISDHNNSAGTSDGPGGGNASLTGQTSSTGEAKKKDSSSSKTVSIVDTVLEDEDSGVRMEERWMQEQMTTPFLFLSLDIPPTPLFKVPHLFLLHILHFLTTLSLCPSLSVPLSLSLSALVCRTQLAG
jgi:hypothetical protein